MRAVVLTNLSGQATSRPANPASANTNRICVHRYRINKVVLACGVGALGIDDPRRRARRCCTPAPGRAAQGKGPPGTAGTDHVEDRVHRVATGVLLGCPPVLVGGSRDSIRARWSSVRPGVVRMSRNGDHVRDLAAAVWEKCPDRYPFANTLLYMRVPYDLRCCRVGGVRPGSVRGFSRVGPPEAVGE